MHIGIVVLKVTAFKKSKKNINRNQFIKNSTKGKNYNNTI